VAVPDCEVTTTVIVLTPTDKLIGDDDAPGVLATPLTVIVAFCWVTYGVIWNELTAFAKLTEYEVVDELNTGDKVPIERFRALRVATDDGARVIVRV